MVKILTKNGIMALDSDVAEAIMHDDIALAGSVLARLGILYKMQSTGADISPFTAQKLNKAAVLMKLIKLPSLSQEECLGLMRDRLLDAYLIPDYNLTEKLRIYADLIELEDEKVSFMYKAVDALRKNRQKLGDGQVVVNGRVMDASLGSWIEDYEAFPTQNARRGNLDTLNYLTKSPNAAKLSGRQHEILAEILKIYDSFKNHIADFNSTPISQQKDEVFRNFNLAFFFSDLTSRDVNMPGELASIFKQNTDKDGASAVSGMEQHVFDPAKQKSLPKENFATTLPAIPKAPIKEGLPFSLRLSEKKESSAISNKDKTPGKNMQSRGISFGPYDGEDGREQSVLKKKGPLEIKKELEEKKKVLRNIIDEKLEELSVKVKKNSVKDKVR